MTSAIPTIAIACPICKATGNREVCVTRDYVYHIHGEYRFVRCDRCSHVFMNPRPTDDAIMRCYPAVYRPYTPADTSSAEAAAAPASPPPVSRSRQLVRRVPGLRKFLFWLGESNARIMPDPPRDGESRLLEIGCAHGGYLQQAQERGWVVTGVEPSEEAAKVARQRGMDVKVGKIEEVQIPDASQDAVVAWMVLEHVPNPVDFINCCFRVLRPGGLLALSVPNATSLERFVTGRYWQGYDAPRHLQVFSASEIRRLLVDAGFVDIAIIHHSTMRAFYASIGGFGAEHFPNAKWPERWLTYFREDPPPLIHWMSLAPAKLLAFLRWSGRINVVARKPE